jgi:signal transduction histidine kinase
LVGYFGLLVVVASADIAAQLLRRKADELQAWRVRAVAAADTERRRIERDLHDGTQQHLTSVAVGLLLAGQLAGQDRALASLLAETGAEVRDTAQELRSLTHGIYPPLLREQGLASALSAAASHSPLPTRVQAGGFEAADHGLGAGFLNMADRIGAFRGQLRVSSAPGQGTRVTGEVPVLRTGASRSGSRTRAVATMVGPWSLGTRSSNRRSRAPLNAQRPVIWDGGGSAVRSPT